MLALLVGCGWGDPCGNEVLASVTSPDGGVVAVVFQRDCGATTDFSTQVSAVPSGAKFLEQPTVFRATQKGNVFIADRGGSRPDGWEGGGPWAQASWSTQPDTLIIKYDPGARVFVKQSSALGRNVKYEAVWPR